MVIWIFGRGVGFRFRCLVTSAEWEVVAMRGVSSLTRSVAVISKEVSRSGRKGEDMEEGE